MTHWRSHCWSLRWQRCALFPVFYGAHIFGIFQWRNDDRTVTVHNVNGVGLHWRRDAHTSERRTLFFAVRSCCYLCTTSSEWYWPHAHAYEWRILSWRCDDRYLLCTTTSELHWRSDAHAYEWRTLLWRSSCYSLCTMTSMTRSSRRPSCGTSARHVYCPLSSSVIWRTTSPVGW